MAARAGALRPQRESRGAAEVSIYTLDRLIAMTRHLGDPDKDYVILGEGNTSARVDEETFWVKASGSRMEQIGPDGFVLTRFAPVLALLDAGFAWVDSWIQPMGSWDDG